MYTMIRAADSEDLDQTAHLPCLIWDFVVRACPVGAAEMMNETRTGPFLIYAGNNNHDQPESSRSLIRSDHIT